MSESPDVGVFRSGRVHPHRCTSMENLNNNAVGNEKSRHGNSPDRHGDETGRHSSGGSTHGNGHVALGPTWSSGAEMTGTQRGIDGGRQTWGPQSANLLDGAVLRRRNRVNIEDIARLIGEDGAHRLEPHLGNRASIYSPLDVDTVDDVYPSETVVRVDTRGTLDRPRGFKTARGNTFTREFAKQALDRSDIIVL